MKDKEKQIWQDVANVMCECEDKENFNQRYRTKCRGCNLLGVIRHIVFFLNNSEYQKLPKDSVLLSREEYEKLAIEYKRWEKLAIEDMLAQERKETAEKSIEIINCVKEKFMNGKRYKEAYKSCQDDFFVQGYIQAIYDCIGELAKQIGCNKGVGV